MVGSNDLNADGQSLIVEASGRGKCGTSGHCDREHALHPFMIGRHLLARNLPRPMQVYVEWKQLSRRDDEIIVPFEKQSDGLIPFRSHG